MGNVFAGSEVIEMGIQIEKNGKDFYDALAARTKNEKAREMYKYLAGEEERHITVFRKILSSVRTYEPQEAYPGEYFAYMSALASDYVFTKKDMGKAMAGKTKDDKEAIDKGMGFEKDSIVFYEGMKKAVSKEESNVIDMLIGQEQSHLKKLVELKENL